MGEIVIEQLTPDGGWAKPEAEPAATAYGTVLEAQKWLKANGEEGKSYRIIRVVEEMTIKVETVRKVAW
jgi:hypothetical protein